MKDARKTHTLGDKREINGQKQPEVIHIWGVLISHGKSHGQ